LQRFAVKVEANGFGPVDQTASCKTLRAIHGSVSA
jgi:hypothetical protein